MRLTESAKQDLADAGIWYERAERGLGEQLFRVVDAAIDLLADHATAFPVVHGDVRRLALRRFPYGLYYLVENSEVIIVGCFHARRDPATWIERAAEQQDEA